ncbi:MAG: hypothetical protein Tsb0019_13530 [Roseibium sp.]
MKRLVVYCPGYDLRPANLSFRLIRSEFGKFIRLHELTGSLGDIREGLDPGGSTATWSGHMDWPEGSVSTRFVQLGWHDVIRPDFQRTWLRTVRDALVSFHRYARAGGYRAVFKSNRWHALFCLYPAVGIGLYLAACLLPPLLLAPAVLARAEAVAPQGLEDPVAWAVLLAASGFWMAGVHVLMRWLEPRTYFRYLVNSWHFMSRLANGEHSPMQARIEEFADLIVSLEEEAKEDEDFVFVSHSCGTFVAIYVLAAVLARKPEIVRRPGGFAFVTLGPAFDCLGGFGTGGGYSQAMTAVARSGVDWTDLYGPHDMICGGRTDPVARYALPVPAERRLPEPRRFSVCIPDRMPERTFRRIRFRFFQLHFCYFFASIRPGLFDFYRLTFGRKRATEQLEAWAAGRD